MLRKLLWNIGEVLEDFEETFKSKPFIDKKYLEKYAHPQLQQTTIYPLGCYKTGAVTKTDDKTVGVDDIDSSILLSNLSSSKTDVQRQNVCSGL